MRGRFFSHTYILPSHAFNEKTVPAAKSQKKYKARMRRKKKYKDWEKQVHGMYSARMRPKPGCPRIMRRNKVIVVVDFVNARGVPMHDRVAQGDADVPARHTLQMYHIGRKHLDGVQLGRETRDGADVFKHPALDFGGLTNVIQSVGESLEFVDAGASPICVTATCNIPEVCKSMHTAWLEHSGKSRFIGERNLKKECQRWVTSVVALLRDGAGTDSHAGVGRVAHLRFFRLPLETRLIVASDDVKKHVGRYYLRQFGTDDRRAWACDALKTSNMFLSISENGRITPNLNAQNISNEYEPV